MNEMKPRKHGVIQSTASGVVCPCSTAVGCELYQLAGPHNQSDLLLLPTAPVGQPKERQRHTNMACTFFAYLHSHTTLFISLSV